jgi:hypothetical protein
MSTSNTDGRQSASDYTEETMGFNAIDCALSIAGAAGLSAKLGPEASIAAGGVALVASDTCLGSHTDPGTYSQTVYNASQGTTTTYTQTVAPPGETGSLSVSVDYGPGGGTLTETWSDDGSHTVYDSQTDTTYGLDGTSSWVISGSDSGDDGTAGKAAN